MTKLAPHSSTQNGHVAPILYRIVHGSSSTSLNLIRRRREEHGLPPLFHNPSLMRTIIFKFPNFSLVSSPVKGGEIELQHRPIETAIYVPHDDRNPMAGGYGLYIRQPEYRQLLLEHLGIRWETEESIQDLRFLDLIDSIPSLDPYLVRTKLDVSGMQVPSAYFEVSPAEAREIRRVIESRIIPILHKAYAGHGAMTYQRMQRIIDSIWDPSIPESTMFIEAFGINRSEAPEILFALQGITFYEYMFNRGLEQSSTVLSWLQTESAQPIDTQKYGRKQIEELHRLRGQIFRDMSSYAQIANEIFDEYESALNAFSQQANPGPLRMFLLNADRRFWQLGHATTALINCHDIHSNESQQRRTARSVEGISGILQKLRIALTDRAEEHRI